MNILMIGGTGFLGSHIVRKLIPQKHNIFVLSRNPEQNMTFDKSRVSFIKGDLVNWKDIDDLPVNPDIIIYTAMPRFRPGRISRKTFSALKMETESYFRSVIDMAKTKDALLILTSGASFQTAGNDIADENRPVTRTGMAALGTSYDALLKKERADKTLRIIEMLPAQIYGNGGLFANMVKMAKKGRIIILGNGKNRLPRIHVEDCAEAYAQVVKKLAGSEKSDLKGDRFIIADDTSCTVEEFMTELASRFGARRTIKLPRLILKIAVGDIVYKTLTMNTVVSNHHLKEVLGWKPKYPDFKEGIRSLE